MSKPPNAPPKWYDERSGITMTHFIHIQEVATSEQRVLMVRLSKPAAIPLIEQGCPGKPKNLEFLNTDEGTGIATAKTSTQVKQAMDLGYFVVDADGKTAQRNAIENGKTVPQKITIGELKFKWQVRQGQVLDPKLLKPIVPDYDLAGQFDPKSAGRVLAGVTQDGELVKNFTNPEFERIAKALNAKMNPQGNPRLDRVKHGPEEFYSGVRGGCMVFWPAPPGSHPSAGRVLLLWDELAVKEFLILVKRKTLTWKADMQSAPRPETREVRGRKIAQVYTGGWYAERKPTPKELAKMDQLALLNRPSDPQRGKVAQLKEAGKGVLRNQNATMFLAEKFCDALQRRGYANIQSHIQNELTKHENSIAEILSRGEGVLVIIHMLQPLRPYETGHAAYPSFQGMYLQAGSNQQTALDTWLGQARIMKQDYEEHSQSYEEYIWVDPAL